MQLKPPLLNCFTKFTLLRIIFGCDLGSIDGLIISGISFQKHSVCHITVNMRHGIRPLLWIGISYNFLVRFFRSTVALLHLQMAILINWI